MQNLTRQMGFFVMAGVFALKAAYALESSIILQCNEEASVISVVRSQSEFGKLGRDHLGWSSLSQNGKIRSTEFPYALRVGRSISASCSIAGKKIDVALRQVERSSIRDECDETIRLDIKVGGVSVIDSVPFGFSGCVDEDANLEAFYFSLPTWEPKGIRPGFQISGSFRVVNKSLSSSNEMQFFNIITDYDLKSFYRTSKRIVYSQPLPLNSSNVVLGLK